MIVMWLMVLAAALASIGAALVGGRMDWLADYQILATFGFGLLASLAVAVVAVVAAMVLPFSAVRRQRFLAWLLLMLVAVAPLVGTVYLLGTDHLRQPLIHDITTDVRNPPPFVFVEELRGPRDHPVTYRGQRMAALQRLHFPDLQPLEVAVPPEEAFALILGLLQDEGLELVGTDAQALRLEATWRSPWLRLHHDVAVQVVSAPGGSRIDIRSASRAAGADLGTNARMVRQLLTQARSRVNG